MAMSNQLEKAPKYKKVFLYSLVGWVGIVVLIALTNLLPTSIDFMYVQIAFLVASWLSLLAVIITFLFWIAALIANQAAQKGRNWKSFFILSIFFPFIMWIIVSVMTTDQSQPTSGTKKCPKCAEWVKSEATLCKHCGSAI